jgi:hypothetical protein
LKIKIINELLTIPKRKLSKPLLVDIKKGPKFYVLNHKNSFGEARSVSKPATFCIGS